MYPGVGPGKHPVRVDRADALHRALNRRPIVCVDRLRPNQRVGEGEVVMRFRPSRIGAVLGLAAILGGTMLWASSGTASSSLLHSTRAHTVVIPDADKFVPYHITVRIGDTVTWVNNDTDNHSVVSDDMFN